MFFSAEIVTCKFRSSNLLNLLQSIQHFLLHDTLQTLQVLLFFAKFFLSSLFFLLSLFLSFIVFLSHTVLDFSSIGYITITCTVLTNFHTDNLISSWLFESKVVLLFKIVHFLISSVIFFISLIEIELVLFLVNPSLYLNYFNPITITIPISHDIFSQELVSLIQL